MDEDSYERPHSRQSVTALRSISPNIAKRLEELQCQGGISLTVKTSQRSEPKVRKFTTNPNNPDKCKPVNSKNKDCIKGLYNEILQADHDESVKGNISTINNDKPRTITNNLKEPENDDKFLKSKKLQRQIQKKSVQKVNNIPNSCDTSSTLRTNSSVEFQGLNNNILTIEAVEKRTPTKNAVLEVDEKFERKPESQVIKTESNRKSNSANLTNEAIQKRAPKEDGVLLKVQEKCEGKAELEVKTARKGKINFAGLKKNKRTIQKNTAFQEKLENEALLSEKTILKRSESNYPDNTTEKIQEQFQNDLMPNMRKRHEKNRTAKSKLQTKNMTVRTEVNQYNFDDKASMPKHPEQTKKNNVLETLNENKISIVKSDMDSGMIEGDLEFESSIKKSHLQAKNKTSDTDDDHDSDDNDKLTNRPKESMLPKIVVETSRSKQGKPVFNYYIKDDSGKSFSTGSSNITPDIPPQNRKDLSVLSTVANKKVFAFDHNGELTSNGNNFSPRKSGVNYVIKNKNNYLASKNSTMQRWKRIRSEEDSDSTCSDEDTTTPCSKYPLKSPKVTKKINNAKLPNKVLNKDLQDNNLSSTELTIEEKDEFPVNAVLNSVAQRCSSSSGNEVKGGSILPPHGAIVAVRKSSGSDQEKKKIKSSSISSETPICDLRKSGEINQKKKRKLKKKFHNSSFVPEVVEDTKSRSNISDEKMKNGKLPQFSETRERTIGKTSLSNQEKQNGKLTTFSNRVENDIRKISNASDKSDQQNEISSCNLSPAISETVGDALKKTTSDQGKKKEKLTRMVSETVGNARRKTRTSDQNKKKGKLTPTLSERVGDALRKTSTLDQDQGEKTEKLAPALSDTVDLKNKCSTPNQEKQKRKLASTFSKTIKNVRRSCNLSGDHDEEEFVGKKKKRKLSTIASISESIEYVLKKYCNTSDESSEKDNIRKEGNINENLKNTINKEMVVEICNHNKQLEEHIPTENNAFSSKINEHSGFSTSRSGLNELEYSQRKRSECVGVTNSVNDSNDCRKIMSLRITMGKDLRVTSVPLLNTSVPISDKSITPGDTSGDTGYLHSEEEETDRDSISNYSEDGIMWNIKFDLGSDDEIQINSLDRIFQNSNMKSHGINIVIHDVVSIQLPVITSDIVQCQKIVLNANVRDNTASQISNQNSYSQSEGTYEQKQVTCNISSSTVRGISNIQNSITQDSNVQNKNLSRLTSTSKDLDNSQNSKVLCSVTSWRSISIPNPNCSSRCGTEITNQESDKCESDVVEHVNNSNISLDSHNTDNLKPISLITPQNLDICSENNFTETVTSKNLNPCLSTTDGEKTFKLPVLPAAKRPPTRIKSQSSQCEMLESSEVLTPDLPVTSDQSTVQGVASACFDTDDVLSIATSYSISKSTTGNAEERPLLEEFFNLPNDTNVDEEPRRLEEPEQDIEDIGFENIKTTAPTVDNISSLQHSQSPQTLDNDGVLNWLTTSSFSANKSDVPDIFENLCYSYFNDQRCQIRSCERVHCTQDDMKIKIDGLIREDLLEAYKYAAGINKLYIKTFNFFVGAFKNLNLPFQLIESINDILTLELYNKTPLIERVIFTLQSLGISFTDVIKRVIDFHGVANTCLIDILLEIIWYTEKEEIQNKWFLVIKMINERKEPLDHGLVSDMITLCNETKNIALASNIYKSFVLSHIVKLDAIDMDTLNNFCILFRSYNLGFMEEYIRRQISLQNQQKKYSASNRSNSSQGSLMKSSSQFHFHGPAQLSNHTTTNFSNGSDRILNELRENKDDVNVNNSVTLTGHEDNLSSCSVSSRIDALDSTAVPLPECDMRDLKKILDEENSLAFVSMLNKFKGTTFSESFVLNSLSYLKKKLPEEIHAILIQLIMHLDKKSFSFLNDIDLKHMLHMLAVNVMGLLEEKHAYKEASNILWEFRQDLQSLKVTKWFISIHRNNYSQMGQYIYFCKIFIKGHFLKEAWEILGSPVLKLLHGSKEWTVQHSEPFDSEFRDHALKDLITVAINTDTEFAHHVILHILSSTDCIPVINMWAFFNQVLVNMLDDIEKFTPELVNITEKKILEGWYTHLSKPVMRGLLICMVSKISDGDTLRLYNQCCQQKYYPHIRGDEKSLTLKTNMVIEEIYMTLRFYFYKKVKNNFLLTDLTLMIRLSENSSHQPKVLLEVDNVKTKIYKILSRGFDFIINADYGHKNPYVTIQADQMRPCFEYYTKLHNNTLIHK